ncbi:MAG: 5'/3'-nucleotidase SurE [Syntrophomonadaceae bacterium]|nr:5'/3'-nucleotidase SurE [Syntrophomonadaceae bacterium]
MKLLIANDDGINAPGLSALVTALKGLGTIYVAAPAHEQSGTGHCITVRDPIRVRRHTIEGAEDAWVIGGTPADCVKIALAKLAPPKIDLVVSGINHGYNLGSDVLYSGTVSAAAEGVIMGCPSIAFSLGDHDPRADLTVCIRFARQLIEEHRALDIVPGELLNVNFPPLPAERIRGVRFTKLGRRSYGNLFEERHDPRGNSYYWMGGAIEDEMQDEDSDVLAVDAGYISITPLSLDLTNYRTLEVYREKHVLKF